MTFHHANPYSLSAILDAVSPYDVGRMDVLGMFCVAFVATVLYRAFVTRL